MSVIVVLNIYDLPGLKIPYAVLDIDIRPHQGFPDALSHSLDHANLLEIIALRSTGRYFYGLSLIVAGTMLKKLPHLAVRVQPSLAQLLDFTLT